MHKKRLLRYFMIYGIMSITDKRRGNLIGDKGSIRSADVLICQEENI